MRPTSNRVREALFDIVGVRVQGSRFMDSFAGTGAVGIEALSRGAASCLFIETDSRLVRCIRENLASCGLEESAEVVQGSLPSCLMSLPEGLLFDLVFLDPPYESLHPTQILEEVDWKRWLSPGGWLIVEHATRRAQELRASGLQQARTVRYGDSSLSFFESAGEVPSFAKKV
jgi:16S rRNA (guanine(966)-N(2))-methyltransferase RsmD